MTPPFSVKPAELNNIAGIINVLHQNLVEHKKSAELETISQQGFLIQAFTTEDLNTYLDDKENYTVLVSCEGNNIVGYTIGHHIQKLSGEFGADFKKTLSTLWDSQKILYLKHIAKLPGLKQVGPALLEQLLKNAIQQGYQYVTCAIAEHPIKNIPSINFHTKFGFERVGNAHFKQYTYGIYLRKL